MSENSTPKQAEQRSCTADRGRANDTCAINVSVLALILAITALAWSAYSYFWPAKQTIHIVDLAGISRTYQEQARNQGLQQGISNEQRAQILQNLQARMNTLQQAVNEFVSECGCNVYVKSALVGRDESVVDVTAEIVKRVEAKVPASAAVVAPQGDSSPVNLPE